MSGPSAQPKEASPASAIPLLPPPEAPPPPAHSRLRHLRATVVFLALAILVSGVGYPLVVTGIAQVIDPSAANGSILRDPNGTIIGSSLIAQNTSAPYLFWERPSLADYNNTLGASTPPGPSDPALGALLNETIAYMNQAWNFSVNHTLPYWLVAPSASSADPDLVPEAVLIQVPRVAAATNHSIAFVMQFVNAHITNPVIPFVGVPYVNVLELDIAWLSEIGK
jgi:potassium-transporting ATPase KdpC subunit